MSLLRYYNKGFGEAALKSHAYNQAVRVGDTIHLSGQGMSHPPLRSDWPSMKNTLHQRRREKNTNGKSKK